MNALTIGPFAFDANRLAAVAAILFFTFTAGFLARRRDWDDAKHWSTWAILSWLVGARVGFVLSNLADYAEAPLDALKFWQGGFSVLSGWITAFVVIGSAAMIERNKAVIAPLLIAGVLAGSLHQVVIAAIPQHALPMPQMNLAALDDTPVALAGRDRVVVLNLWATWCPPCRREMPMMTELAAAMPDVDFVFANQGESAAQILRFLMSEDLPRADMLRDQDGLLMEALGAVGLPSTLVFNHQGALVHAHTGEISRAALRIMIETAKDMQ